MAWYTLFVTTGYEQKIARVITESWRIDGLRSFVPMKDVYFRKAGKVLTEKIQWIPGYVFLESEHDGLEFYLISKSYISRTKNVFRLLHYGSEHVDLSYEMRETERAFLQRFLDDEQCVKMSKGYIKGTSIIVTDGPMVGLEGMIRKVNRHKMEATIEASFLGSVREVVVGLEIIKKLP